MNNPVQPDYKSLYHQALLEKESLLVEKEKELVQMLKTVEEQREQIGLLHFELDKFRRILFGKRSEKQPLQPVDLSQLHLFDLSLSVAQQEELSEQAVESAVRKAPAKRPKGTGRMALPEELEREYVLIEPQEDVTGYVIIGQDKTEVLEIEPARLKVVVFLRNIYAHPDGNGIVQGQLPDRVVAKGIPSNRLVARMALDKYVHHLPLHRQIEMYKRLGVHLPASTVSDWLLKAWRHLVPLWELMKLTLRHQRYLQVDETPFKALDRTHKNNIQRGYMWVYHSPVDNLVVFDYRSGRDKSGPMEMLQGFTGILQTDGFSVYDSLYKAHDQVYLTYCMAHARRYFVEALAYDKQRAGYVVEKMGLLYHLEEQMREQKLSWQERSTQRQQIAAPILQELGQWLKEQSMSVLPKSPIGKAIDYALLRWSGLSAYVMHGQMEIDNNLVENAIRPVALGRKNYLFAGSTQAAEMTAAMYSFMATCKKNGVDELEWLTDVLEKAQNINHKKLYTLLPNYWKKN